MTTKTKIHDQNFEPFAKLAPFTQEDWFGFAGAEEFKDGRQPLVGEVDLDSGENEGIIVVDANGIQIFLDQFGEEDWEWTFYMDSDSEIRTIKTLEDLAILAKQNDKGVYLEDLIKDFGFQEI